MAEVKKTTTKTTTKSSATKTTSKTATKATATKAEPAKKTTTAKKPVAKKAGKQIKVTLVKSTIGYDKKQAKIVKALGLGKLNSTHILPDNACVRGMVNRISHLVKVEEL